MKVHWSVSNDGYACLEVSEGERQVCMRTTKRGLSRLWGDGCNDNPEHEVAIADVGRVFLEPFTAAVRNVLVEEDPCA